MFRGHCQQQSMHFSDLWHRISITCKMWRFYTVHKCTYIYSLSMLFWSHNFSRYRASRYMQLVRDWLRRLFLTLLSRWYILIWLNKSNFDCIVWLCQWHIKFFKGWLLPSKMRMSEFTHVCQHLNMNLSVSHCRFSTNFKRGTRVQGFEASVAYATGHCCLLCNTFIVTSVVTYFVNVMLFVLLCASTVIFFNFDVVIVIITTLSLRKFVLKCVNVVCHRVRQLSLSCASVNIYARRPDRPNVIVYTSVWYT